MSVETKHMKINGYDIYYNEYEGYTAYLHNDNGEDELVYTIDAKYGDTIIETKNGMRMHFSNLSVEDIKPGMTFINDLEDECYFDGTAITKSTYKWNTYGHKVFYDNDLDWEMPNQECIYETIYNDNDSVTRAYDTNGNVIYETFDNGEGAYSVYPKGTAIVRYENINGVLKEKIEYTSEPIINYFDEYGDLYCIKRNDGSCSYLFNTQLKTYSDGTYTYGIEKGTYTIDEDGHIICKDENGNQRFCDRFGRTYEIVYKDGSSVVYDINNGVQITTRNGKTSYSKLNHIEYDEEAYDKILTTLNEIDGTSIENKCSKIVDTVNSFPDKCSSSGIEGVKGNINNHVSLVKSLSEMTNYSLLAYQTCDEELREGLYLLVDSLFGENELGLAASFKNAIRETIEDRDNDNILEYKEGTNFEELSENVLVTSTYIDSDGNKWYLNKNNIVLGIEGNDIKLNYGGEIYGDTFSVTCDKNGIIKLVDSNGNPLNIFGDYNIDSVQYGGNQGNFYNLIYNRNRYVDNIVDEYFPEYTDEERCSFFSHVASTSCGNVAIANVVFKNFEGKEEEFYKTFGYPMYDIKYDSDSGLSVDYNYEPLAMDLFCHTEKGNIIQMGNMSKRTEDIYGTDPNDLSNMINYLNEKYNVSLDESFDDLVHYGEVNYNLYNMDGSINTANGKDHSMIGVGEKVNGNPVVSSWGQKLILELSTDLNDREYGADYFLSFGTNREN